MYANNINKFSMSNVSRLIDEFNGFDSKVKNNIGFLIDKHKEISFIYKTSCDEMSIFGRMNLKIKSLFKETTLTKFNKFEKDCLQLGAKTYEGHILDLQKKISHSPDSSEKKLLKKIMSVVKKNILDCRTGEGFVYQIKNKEKIVVGHLIGTIHPPSKLSRNISITKDMKKAIEDSSTLITELGTSPIPNILGYHTIDAKITRHALKKGKKIKAFETILQQLKIIFNIEEIKNEFELISEKKDFFKKNFNKILKSKKPWGVSVNFSSIFKSSDISSYYLVDRWKKGDETTLERIASSTPSSLLEDRNRKWLEGEGKKEGLLSQLNKATGDRQICVAVGAAHLFGCAGLVEELEAQGFTVERVKK